MVPGIFPGLNTNSRNWLTAVGKEAFYGCRYLESVTIPASLEVIPEAAFRNCRDLKHITIENGVRKVEADAFMGCKQLESVVLPNSVTSCDFFSFGGCDSMKSIALERLVISSNMRLACFTDLSCFCPRGTHFATNSAERLMMPIEMRRI